MKNNTILTKELANCVRFLSIDAVQRANSGHPGMPMGMADIATDLFYQMGMDQCYFILVFICQVIKT